MPDNFEVSNWVHINLSSQDDRIACLNLCELIVDDKNENKTMLLLLPDYLADLDPNGEMTGEFIARWMNDHPNMSNVQLSRLARLVSGYNFNFDAFRRVASLILYEANQRTDDERERIFSSFCLSKSDKFHITSSDKITELKRVVEMLHQELLKEKEEHESPLLLFREWHLKYYRNRLTGHQIFTEEPSIEDYL
jgi:hypothetical protein